MDDFVRRPERPATDIQSRQPAPPVSRPVAATSRPSETTPEQPEPAQADKKPADKPMPPRARAPVAAILVAVLVSAGLVVLTVFAYNKQKQADAPATEPVAETETVDDQTVQDASDSIDETLGELDDSADFNETDTSDEALGL